MRIAILNRKVLKEIAIHVVIWLFFFTVLNYQVYSEIRYVPREILYRSLYRTLLNIGLFYLNYAFLVPRFLLKKKLPKYVLISLAIIILSTFVIRMDSPAPGAVVVSATSETVENDSLSPYAAVTAERDSVFIRKGENMMPGPPFTVKRRFLSHGAENVEIRIPPGFNSWKIHLIMSLKAAMVLGMYFVIGASIKIYMEWKKGEAVRKQIQSEKITSELQFLKTQLNPHFLFNSLNSIYSLSVKKSNDTPEAVITLSDLMRYMLYEANREYVPLARELEYIKNYIKLQRLRLSNGEQVTLNIYGDEKDKKIQPLLFISFIENAFKYGTDYTGKTVVKTVINIEEDSIRFYIRNIIGRYKKNSKSSGVGLKNIKNRLELLYPDSHKLDIEDDGAYFTVSLTLNFT